MRIKIGIPRALLYYDYFLLWSTFLERLGTEIVLSQKTNKEIVYNGIKSAIEETCLPVKVFLGHVQDLARKKVDYIFIPRYISVEPRRFLCPKFMGLPYMIKHLLPGIPPVLNVEVDLRKRERQLPVEMYRLGKLFTFNPWKIRLAYKLAQENQKSFKKNILQGFLPENVYFNETEKNKALKRTVLKNNQHKNVLRIGLIGHSYNLYDEYVNMNILNKLQEMGVEIITSKMFSEAEINSGLKRLRKDIFWTFGKETIGSAFYLLEERITHGIILIVSFACGPDSIIMDLIDRAYKRAGVPCLTLVLDEHSAEGGVITRLEAFIEMLKWKEQKNESYFSPHGQPVDCPESPF